MNKRIKELAKQSTVDIKDEFGHWINSEFDKEKFTQMIVQECIDINREELSFVAFNVLLDRYHEHFGIKE
jgi:hypothetical protein